MISRLPRRIAAALLTVAVATTFTACSDTTAPTTPKRAAPATAKLDDEPTTPCRSGWVNIGGVWVCENP